MERDAKVSLFLWGVGKSLTYIRLCFYILIILEAINNYFKFQR
jgi:hypothetical protein